MPAELLNSGTYAQAQVAAQGGYFQPRHLNFGPGAYLSYQAGSYFLTRPNGSGGLRSDPYNASSWESGTATWYW